MKKINAVLLLVALLVSTFANAESVISKADADKIFSMKKDEWNSNAPKYVFPNWETKVKNLDTGDVVIAIDTSTGYGLSIRPSYQDSNSLPATLIVGSFYPTGTIKASFSDVKKEIEADAEKDLGGAYAVTAKYAKVTPEIEGIELTITLKSNKK